MQITRIVEDMVAGRREAARVAEAFGVLLLRSSRSHLYADVIGTASGVDETTYPVLSGVARLGTPTATELADQIGLDRTVTTRYASRLEAAGLLARHAHPDDARATALRLTPRGRRVVDAMRERLDARVALAMAGWTAAERRAFADRFEQFARDLGSPH